jgi:DNA end-binding protein Ku
MARPTWNGTISFALLSIPVKLYTAQRPKDISFNQLERSTGQRIKQRRVSSVSGEEVAADEIVKGYDLGGGRWVEVEQNELDALAPRDAANERTVRILEFVDLDEIDPIYFEKAYYVAPDRGGARAYALLVKALKATHKVAVAKVVIRSKEYLTTLRPLGNMLCMETMLFADEVVDPAEVDGLPEAEVEISDRELEMAKLLVESSSSEFDASRYRDEYRDKVVAMLEAKAEGRAIEAPAATQEPVKVVDLMAALEASLSAAKDRKSA